MVRLFALVATITGSIGTAAAAAAQSNGPEEIEQWFNEQWNGVVNGQIGTLLLWGVAVVLVLLLARFREMPHHDPMHPAPTRVHIDYGPRQATYRWRKNNKETSLSEDQGKARKRGKPGISGPWG